MVWFLIGAFRLLNLVRRSLRRSLKIYFSSCVVSPVDLCNSEALHFFKISNQLLNFLRLNFVFQNSCNFSVIDLCDVLHKIWNFTNNWIWLVVVNYFLLCFQSHTRFQSCYRDSEREFPSGLRYGIVANCLSFLLGTWVWLLLWCAPLEQLYSSSLSVLCTRTCVCAFAGILNAIYGLQYNLEILWLSLS